jgi:transcriptional regulator with XRE-family HTH domain
MMNIGQAIKLCRVRRGLTQTELARRLGCHFSYISLLESGKRDPSLSSVERLAAALDVPLLILFFLAEDQNKLLALDQTIVERLSWLSLHLLLPSYQDAI